MRSSKFPCLKVVVFLLLCGAIIGCSGEGRAWKEAQASNTPVAYQELPLV